jgi:LytS/YehU family sensor histidine kinase
MNTIFNDVCVLVAAAFALTLVPGFRNLERSLLSRRDQGAVLLVFTILGLVEEAAVSDAGLLNQRIVAVCAAGLVAGPWVGLAVGVFVTWLAVAHHGLPLGAITTSMLGGGLTGGWRPKLAQRPLTGFGLTFGVSLLRSGFLLFFAPHPAAILHRLEEIGMAPVARFGRGVDSGYH